MSENSKGPPNLPSGFEPGDPLTAESLESLRNALAFALKDLVRGGRGITVTQSGGRFLVSAKRGRGRGGEDHPWRPSVAPFLGDGDPPSDQRRRVRVRPGTVGNRIPGNWDAEITIPSDTMGHWVWAEVTITDTGEVTAVQLQDGATPPAADLVGADGSLPTTLYQPLFSVDTGSDAVRRFYPLQKKNLAVEITNGPGGCADILRSVQLIDA